MSSSSVNEKQADQHVEGKLEEGVVDRDLSRTNSEDAILAEFTPEEIKKVLRTVDLRLVTTAGVMYCISLMDRTNLSSAAIAGMTKELELGVGLRYSTVTLVFFPTYIAFQFASTVIIRFLGPRLHLAGVSLLWGCVMIGMGFVKDWQSLAALRVVLGIFEAGFFPGCVYLLSTWYTRFELHKRYSCFYIIGSLASGCAGILAYGLMQMEGIQGYAGWRWIFIIEGVITVAIAMLGYILLVGFPEDAHKNWYFLSERETKMIIARVNRDRGDAHTEKFEIKKFLSGGLDMKVWGFAIIFGMSTTVSYAISFFLPIILREEMGFSIGKAQCLVAPPYAAAGIWMWLTGWFGDKYRTRGPIVAVNSVITIVGLPLMGWVESVAVQYFGVFLVVMGSGANIPAAMTYQANNIRGHWKRAFCSATLVGFGGIGGIIGSLVFRSQDAPGYRPGLWACITSQLITLLVVAALSYKFKRDNAKVDRGELQIEGSESGFKYTL